MKGVLLLSQFSELNSTGVKVVLFDVSYQILFQIKLTMAIPHPQIEQPDPPEELTRYEEAYSNGAVTFNHLQDLKAAWQRQQLRAIILLPPCEPDAYNLEEKFKTYYEATWGEWGSSYSLTAFNTNGDLENSFLQNCVMIQWKLEEKELNFDKAPFIIHAKAPGNNLLRSYGPSMQVCILGLDPQLLEIARFEAEIKLEGSNINQHTLELMEKQNALPRSERLPYVKFNYDDSQLATAANDLDDEPDFTLRKKRKTRRTIVEEATIRSKVKRLVIECSWKPEAGQNLLCRRELRGCKNEHDDECRMGNGEDFCYKHCIKANFFQLRSHPFIVSPGKQQPKDSELFLNYAWRVLTNRLVVSDIGGQHLNKRVGECS
ncbi:unnamed protein product [Anisakis simplex]|uniref:Protein SMG8 n=1 Tax=Anisakis simplex TaxID=6269 RepID=A0A0M3KAM6_ANISI|nr:unnamed protein product [Anisakis simplex]